MMNRNLYAVAWTLVLLIVPLTPLAPVQADHLCGPQEASSQNGAAGDETMDCVEELVEELLPPLANKLRIRASAPERVWISDQYEISLHLSNQDLGPHVVSVDVLPRTDSVCSIASYGVSSSATQTTRPNEYLLDGNGTNGILGGEAFPIDGDGIFGGDSVSVAAKIKPATPGTCKIDVRITMDALFHRTATMTTRVEMPPAYADLGNFLVSASSCAGATASEGLLPKTLEVAANTPIDVIGALEYLEPCSDDNAVGTLILQQRNPDGSWRNIGSGQAATSGTSDVRAKDKLTLSEGEHSFRVLAGGTTGFKLRWSCVGAIAGAISTVAAIVVAHGGTVSGVAAWLWSTIFTGGSAAAVWIIAAIIAVTIALGVKCLGDGEVFPSQTYMVKAISTVPPAALALNLVNGLVGDAEPLVDALDP